MTNDDRTLLTETHAAVMVLASKAETADTQRAALFSAIEGNGQPGLKQRLTAVETTQSECRRQSGKALVKAAIWVSLFMPLAVVAIQQLLERI